MKVEFLKEEKENITVRLEDEYSTLGNAIKDELWSTKGVDIATLDKRHPLVGKPELAVHGKEPRKLLKTAAQNLKKKVEDFEKAVLKVV